MTEELETIRTGLRRWVRQNAPANSGLSCEEVIRLAGDSLLGYRMAIGDAEAVWNVGETTAEIRSPRGAGLIILSEQPDPARASRAA